MPWHENGCRRTPADGRGGRVLGVTAIAANLFEATGRAYDAVEEIEFEGCSIERILPDEAIVNQYSASGVSIDAGNRAVALMKSAVQSTYGPAVLAGIGSFGGLFDAAS